MYSEASFVNGMHIVALLTSNIERMNKQLRSNRVTSYENLWKAGEMYEIKMKLKNKEL